MSESVSDMHYDQPKQMAYGTEVNHLVPYALGAMPRAYGTRQFKSI